LRALWAFLGVLAVSPEGDAQPGPRQAVSRSSSRKIQKDLRNILTFRNICANIKSTKEVSLMKATEALKKVMELKNVKPSDLCARLGIKSNVLSERFKQKNISVEKLDEMMNVMDYKIVIVPRETRLPEGGFEIE
jgi:hypothetical protein